MNSPTFFVKPERAEEWKEFYQRLDTKGTAPLWEVLAKLVRVDPQTACVPAMWRYDEIRPLLMEAGRLITAKEAERRVLMLLNPGLQGTPQITQSLYAGLQLILPGEVAPTHRHVASALRFVIEGQGAYTAVDGERTTMHPGDFILTPSWTYHDHGNPGTTPVVWLDGLDIPIVNMFDTSFAEHHPAESQPVTRREGDSLVRYGNNLLPLEYKSSSLSAPMFSYPYGRSREALDRLHRHGPPDPCHGVKMQYVNPATGGYPLPTIGAFLQLLPAGFQGRSYRATDATVYCVVEGRGRSQIGTTSFVWGARDVFVVPSWQAVSHEAQNDAVLFSFSDRPAQKSLGLWREEVLTH
ncbi:MAG: gentisate 1,2-dioxygenase [Acidobacteria bacterium]|jgi:gentisate 1,2-dioxygenase|nr:MAG: gentisate 1,2-dioxygenase [Acidobacteriota bacterium]